MILCDNNVTAMPWYLTNMVVMKAQGILISGMSFSVVNIMSQHTPGILITMSPHLWWIHGISLWHYSIVMFLITKYKACIFKSESLRWQKVSTVIMARWVAFWPTTDLLASAVLSATTQQEMFEPKHWPKETKNSDKLSVFVLKFGKRCTYHTESLFVLFILKIFKTKLVWQDYISGEWSWHRSEFSINLLSNSQFQKVLISTIALFKNPDHEYLWKMLAWFTVHCSRFKTSKLNWTRKVKVISTVITKKYCTSTTKESETW